MTDPTPIASRSIRNCHADAPTDNGHAIESLPITPRVPANRPSTTLVTAVSNNMNRLAVNTGIVGNLVINVSSPEWLQLVDERSFRFQRCSIFENRRCSVNINQDAAPHAVETCVPVKDILIHVAHCFMKP
ncbi:hypothetical protein NM208_g12372 [Fusarium decemcellulare]|uniref:Uncharacterized protein n=1 Tax=Fusarium decemcellulare TaxID=57161 RepID=A0ACC1RT93_9HYPO|nr:hypothetical protein NM208_g12372 [Fusarium decemcellulare]